MEWCYESIMPRESSRQSGKIVKDLMIILLAVFNWVDVSAQTELITNGGYEGAVTVWDFDPQSGGWQADSEFAFPHTGSGYAYLSNPDGTRGNDLSGEMYQEVSIPTNATSAQLSFWYSISTTEPETAPDKLDFFSVSIYDVAGNPLEYLGFFGNGNAQGTAYVSAGPYDLLDYVGQAVRIRFHGGINASNPSVIRIDDVSLQITTSNLPTTSVFTMSDLVAEPKTLVTFDASGSHSANGALTYSWDFGDGSAPEIGMAYETIQHEFPKSNTFETYTVSLTVIDASNGQDVSSQVIVVTGMFLGYSPEQAYAGALVNTAIGNFVTSQTDLFITGVGVSFDFTRTYNAQADLTESGPLGFGWTHTYHIYLTTEGDDVTIQFGDGHQEVYKKNPDDTYTSWPNVSSTLLKNEDGIYALTTRNLVVYNFSSDGKLTSISDRSTKSLDFAYTPSGDLDKVTDSVGRVIDFTTDVQGRIIQITDPLDGAEGGPRTVQFEYDPTTGDLRYVTDPRGNRWEYRYQAHFLVEIIDRFGQSILKNDYDTSSGLLRHQHDGYNNTTNYGYSDNAIESTTTVTTPLGFSEQHIYGKNNGTPTFLISRINDSLGSGEEYTFDENRRKIKTEDGRNELWFTDYDDQGNITQQIDGENLQRSFTYDLKNNLTQEKNGEQQTRSWKYKTNNILEWSKDFLGNQINFSYFDSRFISLPTFIQIQGSGGGSIWNTYDAHGNLTQVLDKRGKRWKSEYDSIGRKIKDIDPNDAVTEYVWDNNDNLVQQIDPLGYKTNYVYDENDRLTLKVDDSTGKAIGYTYDANGRLLTEAHGSIQTVTREWDADGREIETVDGRGNSLLRGYDSLGRLTDLTNQLGEVTTYTYDNVDNQKTVTSPKGNTTSNDYDGANRLIRTNHPDGSKTEFAYDGAHRLTKRKLISPDGQDSRSYNFTYDANGRLTKTVGPGSATVQFTYDAVGNRTKITHEGLSINFSYDPNGNLTRITDPQGRITQHTYDDANNLDITTLSDGSTIDRTYNTRNELTRIDYSEELSPFTFNHNGVGSLTRFSNGLGDTSISYDILERPIQQTDPFGNIISFEYDAEHNLTKLVYPGGLEVIFEYDPVGRLIRVTPWHGRSTTYEHDLDGNVSKKVASNGTVTTYTHDNRSRLASLTTKKSDGMVLVNFNLTRDWLGNPIDVDINQPLPPYVPTKSVTFGYDEKRVLTSYEGSPVTYNPNGAVTAIDGWTFAYNQLNHITNASNQLLNIENGYNAKNQRIVRTINGVERRFLVDTTRAPPRVLGEFDAQNNPIAFYIYGNSLLERIDANTREIHCYHEDFIGNTVALTDESENVTDQYSYTPFGEELVYGYTPNPFRFLGSYGILTDGEDLVYLNNRYYLASIGRFLSLDVVYGIDDNPQSFNRYTYALNNPVVYNDLTGLAALNCNGLLAGFCEIGQGLLGVSDFITESVSETVEAIPTFLSFGNDLLFASPQDKTALLISLGGSIVRSAKEDLHNLFYESPDTRSKTEALFTFATTIRGGFIRGAKAPRASAVHKNSLDYVGETHVYRIVGSDGSTYKIGESAQGVRLRDGTSVRAEQQARRLYRNTGDLYYTEILKTFPNKKTARAYETYLIERFRRLYGSNVLPGNKTNR